MISVAEAQALLLADAPILEMEQQPLSQALGRYAAGDLYADAPRPPFDGSAMDGYAVRWADVQELPVRLKVMGQSQAGLRFSGSLHPGEAIRIFTGAPVPPDADTVVVQEDTRAGEGWVEVLGRPAGRGGHIRQAGYDVAAGGLVCRAGDLLEARRIALTAACGFATVPVRRKPRVAIISTGDELRRPGEALGPDGIINSNSYMLAAQLTAAGAEPVDYGVIPDDLPRIQAALADAAEACDLAVTAGGASVGDRDLIPPALTGLGAALDFWKIAMRPGKPLLAARLGGTRVIGLPGNPVSAFVCCHLFIAPWVRKALGAANPLPLELTGRAALPLKPNGPRADYMRAAAEWRGDHWSVAPLPVQDSGMLSALAAANALLIRPVEAPGASAGDPVQFLGLSAVA